MVRFAPIATTVSSSPTRSMVAVRVRGVEVQIEGGRRIRRAEVMDMPTLQPLMDMSCYFEGGYTLCGPSRLASADHEAGRLHAGVRPATGSLRSLPRLGQLCERRRCCLNSAHGAGVIDLLAALGAAEVPQVPDHVAFPRVAIGPILLDYANPHGSTCGTGRYVEWSHRLCHHNALFEETRK